MNKYSGFTLVETLIAAVILFAVLSLSALSLKTARTSSASAERSVQLRTPQTMLISHIKQALQGTGAEQMSGDGVIAGVQYQWEAISISFDAAPPSYDPDMGGQVVYPPRYRLYQVQLNLSIAGKTETLSYKEFGWMAENER